MNRLYAQDTTNNMARAVNCDANGNLQVDVVSGTVSLPSGAATAAKQDTGNTSLSSIDGKITACNTGAVVVSSGTITADLGATDNAVLDSIDTAVNGTLTVDGSGVTQPVSAVSLPLPAGAATDAKQDTGNTSLSSIDTKITACNTGAVVISSGTVDLGATDNAVLDSIVANTNDNATETTLSAINTKLSGTLTVNGSAVTQPTSSVSTWSTVSVFSSQTIAGFDSVTSSTIDFGTAFTDFLHVYILSSPVGVTDLTITVEHSPDNSNWFPSANTLAVTNDTDYSGGDVPSRYVRFKVTNNDASSNDVTLTLGYYA